MNDLEAPYKKIKAAEEQVEYNFLLQLYSDCFRRKFYGPPVFPTNNSHLTTIKDIRKSCGEKAVEIIQHYFEMPDTDGWFTKQGYTLHELYRSLSRVNASFSKKQGVKSSGHQICEIFHCDACWEPFELIHPMVFNYDQLIRCKPCTAENRPLKKVSPQDKLNTLMRLSKHFPPIPESPVIEPAEEVT